MTTTETDKERILREILVWTSRHAHEYRPVFKTVDTVVGRRECHVTDYGNGTHVVPQWISALPWSNSSKLPPVGTIVRCVTNPNHAFGIARFQDTVPDAWQLREIGSQRLCNMHNESFKVLVGMPPGLLLEGWEHQMYEWAHKAFMYRYNPSADSYNARCRSADVVDGVLKISVGRQFGFDYTNREISIPVTPKTRLKDIAAGLVEADFARDWTDAEKKPGK